MSRLGADDHIDRRMPRFYFDLHDDLDAIEEGVVLRDEAAARSLALNSAREIACEHVRHGRLNLKHFISVRGEDREPLFIVAFGEALEVES